MKKTILVGLMLLGFISCNENFEPFGDLKNKYVLNCIIQGDTTFQIASITRTYSNTNYDPYSNETDQNVTGARVRLWNGDSVAIFRDSIFAKPTSSQYKTPYHLYYTNKFVLVGTQLRIEAILPDGVRLTSLTTIPNAVKFLSIEKVVPPIAKSSLHFVWEAGTADNAYLSQVSIYYYKADDPKKQIKIAYVPASYVTKDSRDYPISTKPSNLNGLVIDVSTISKAMELISTGDEDKKNYVILGPFLEVLSFGKDLNSYFNSITRTNDAYTVNLNEIDNTNINNGMGIFGIYLRNYWSFGFTHEYIKSFGYTPGLADVDAHL